MSLLKVRRTGYALGAEVTGVDLREPLDGATVEGIKKIWLEHPVLCFPRQDIDAAQLMRFASSFGELDKNENSPSRDRSNPFVMLASNKPVNGKPWSGYKQGQSWHSDRSFTLHPDLGTFLLGKEIPPVGGDTLFANMYLAYETLSRTLRGIIDGLSAVHDASKIKGYEKRGAEAAEYLRVRPPVVHPVVKVHPETGRKALYVGDRVRKFFGMTEEESAPLLGYLTNHATSYEITYRHRWSVNDLLIWDNRCTMHLAVSDYDLRGDIRHMLRCSVLGPPCGRPYVADEEAREIAEAALVAR